MVHELPDAVQPRIRPRSRRGGHHEAVFALRERVQVALEQAQGRSLRVKPELVREMRGRAIRRIAMRKRGGNGINLLIVLHSFPSVRSVGMERHRPFAAANRVQRQAVAFSDVLALDNVSVWIRLKRGRVRVAVDRRLVDPPGVEKVERQRRPPRLADGRADIPVAAVLLPPRNRDVGARLAR